MNDAFLGKFAFESKSVGKSWLNFIKYILFIIISKLIININKIKKVYLEQKIKK